MARHQFLVCWMYTVFAAGLHLQCQAGRILPTEVSSVDDMVLNRSRTLNMEDRSPSVEVPVNYKKSRKMIRECTAATSGNPIDECWRCDPQWRQNRQALAKCAIGAGRNAVGGGNGRTYLVTDNSDVDARNPTPGTLRYGAIQQEPLWIVFSQDMAIRLRNELILTSFKTIDGRGFNIHISGGAGLTIQSISNVIIHGVHIHDIVSTGPATIRSSPTHVGGRGRTDGDAVNIYSSHDVWIDHCYFARGADGLVDVTMGSSGVTISNSFFTEHDKVMLLGAHPRDVADRDMHVTVAYNHFGPSLIQRLPRVGMYAIGGSEESTIVSQGNVFTAPNGVNKEVSKRLQDEGDGSFSDPQSWNWQSLGDIFLNGAFFKASGALLSSEVYSTTINDATALPATMVATMTTDAGPLACTFDEFC